MRVQLPRDLSWEAGNLHQPLVTSRHWLTVISAASRAIHTQTACKRPPNINIIKTPNKVSVNFQFWVASLSSRTKLSRMEHTKLNGSNRKSTAFSYTHFLRPAKQTKLRTFLFERRAIRVWHLRNNLASFGPVSMVPYGSSRYLPIARTTHTVGERL